MKNRCKKYLVGIIFSAVLILSINVNANPINNLKKSEFEELTFRQEIIIPFDTSLEIAKYQPIDMRIKFNNPCWAKNEEENSVRVGFDDGAGITEIESQIYDLEHTDDSHIESCSLVFIIPGEADGEEKYYVLYDSSEIESANYEDHIVVEDTHYFYEPISGQHIDFDYYGIYQDEEVIYGVIQKGELLGNPVAQNIVKFKPGSKIVETYNVDQLAAFDMRHGIYKEPGYIGSSWADDVTKTILIDGPLMTRMRIECFSPSEDIKTDNIYTYYYCPGETKKIMVNVHHEVLEDIDIEDPELYDGTYAGIISAKSRSATIKKMNVGEILPFITLFSENENILEYEVPQDPTSEKKEAVLSTEADIDLGSKAWICLNDPDIGQAHGLILKSNTQLNEEEDGVQVKAWVKQNIKLPGLEAETGNLFMLRNAYEKNSEHNTKLSKGFTTSFDIEFITTEKEGYTRIDSESTFYQELIKHISILRDDVPQDEDDIEKYSLKTYVHLAPSFPLGTLLSAALGKNFSYIYAELFKETSFKSSGSVGRLPIGSIELDLEGKRFFEKIKTIIGIFDWRNASFFKKIQFPDLDPGVYVVKIFRENPLFSKERQYIGFGIIELQQDESIKIYCRSEGSIKISVFDQKEDGVENVQCLLYRDNVVIAEGVTGVDGNFILKAPCFPLKPYTLKLVYQGFLINEKQVTLGLKNRLIQLKESFSLERYKLDLRLEDTWDFPLAFEVNPKLDSDEMIEAIIIKAEKIADGHYVFKDLYMSDYVLSMNYKSFDLEQNVKVDKDNTVELMFPAEFDVDFNFYNSFGNRLSNGMVSVSRKEKIETKEIDENGNSMISVPPGEYEISVIIEDDEIAKQKIQIRGRKEVEIVTSEDSLIHNILMYLGILLIIFSIIFMFWKKKIYIGLKLVAIGLIIVALVTPWWVLNGDDDSISTSTETFLVPPKIVTATKSSNVIGGEISHVPEEVTMVLSLLSMILAITILFILVSIFIRNRFGKTKILFSVLSGIMLVMSLILFFYVFSQITELGVGSFIGSGDLETTIPGVAEMEIVPSSWGPGIGFILGIISFIVLALLSFSNRFLKKLA